MSLQAAADTSHVGARLPARSDSVVTVAVAGAEAPRKNAEVSVWVPYGALGVSSLAFILAFCSYALSRRVFQQTRARATFHSLVTAGAIKDVPQCGDAIDTIIKEEFPHLLGACGGDVVRSVLPGINERTMNRITETLTPVQGTLSRSTRAWGDQEFMETVGSDLMAWEADLTAALNRFGGSSNPTLKELRDANINGQARVLHSIVKKDRSDLTM